MDQTLEKFNHSTPIYDAENNLQPEIKEFYSAGNRLNMENGDHVHTIFFSKGVYIEGKDFKQIKVYLNVENVFDYRNKEHIAHLKSIGLNTKGIETGDYQSFEFTDIDKKICELGYSGFYTNEGGEINSVGMFGNDNINII